MEEEFEDLPRARRRAKMDEIRRQARRKAEREYARQFRGGPDPYWCKDVDWYYGGAMKGQGHWIKGGCSRQGCCLCQDLGPSFRDQRLRDQFDREYRAWRRGEWEESWEALSGEECGGESSATAVSAV